MRVFRSLIVLTIATLALPLIVFSSRAGQNASTDAGRNWELHTVARGRVESTVEAVGEIRADQTATLTMTRSGRVVDIFVEPGDVVQAGDPLVRLDGDAAQLAYEQAVLTLASAQLELEDLLQGPDDGDIRIAQSNVDSAWGAYRAIRDAVTPEQMQAAELRVQQAREAFEAANRARRISGGRSDEAIALMDAEIGEASFNLGIAQQQLEQLRSAGSGADLMAAAARAAQAEAELRRAQAGATDSQIRAAEVRVEQAQVDADQAAVEVRNYTLVAPFDGIVGDVTAELGALVMPGMGVVTLTDLEPLHIMLDVDEIDIRHIREGIPAHVTVDAVAGLGLDAVVERVSLVGSANQEGITSYPVELMLARPVARVLPGMTAEASIVVEAADGVLLVPNRFIRVDRRAAAAFVSIVDASGALTEVPVELGLQGEDASEVRSGLEEGDVVILDLDAEQFSFFGG